jgi:hypothetical protein
MNPNLGVDTASSILPTGNVIYPSFFGCFLVAPQPILLASLPHCSPSMAPPSFGIPKTFGEGVLQHTCWKIQKRLQSKGFSMASAGEPPKVSGAVLKSASEQVLGVT